MSDIEYIQLTAPELPSKIKAQQMAGNVDTTLVLTGYDAMASGMDMDIYEQLMPKYKDAFQKTIDNYLPGAKAAYDLFKGYGITMVWCPGGPMFTYNPDKVPNPPKTAAELLAWAKANPGKFMYARPANSGPGRAFLQGLPYILGDKNPKDPTTWDKTWAYLKELDNYIDYYPTGTGITFKELGQGTRWILASHLGWDMQQRILATIPANRQVGPVPLAQGDPAQLGMVVLRDEHAREFPPLHERAAGHRQALGGRQAGDQDAGEGALAQSSGPDHLGAQGTFVAVGVAAWGEAGDLGLAFGALGLEGHLAARLQALGFVFRQGGHQFLLPVAHQFQEGHAGSHEIAFIHLAGLHHAGEGRPDLGVGDVGLQGRDSRLGLGHLGLRLLQFDRSAGLLGLESLDATVVGLDSGKAGFGSLQLALKVLVAEGGWFIEILASHHKHAEIRQENDCGQTDKDGTVYANYIGALKTYRKVKCKSKIWA